MSSLLEAPFGLGSCAGASFYSLRSTLNREESDVVRNLLACDYVYWNIGADRLRELTPDRIQPTTISPPSMLVGHQHVAPPYCLEDRVNLMGTDVLILWGKPRCNPRVGVQEHDNGGAIFFDLLGDFIEVGFAESRFCAKVGIPSKNILVDFDFQFDVFRQSLNLIDIAKVTEYVDWQRFRASVDRQLVIRLVRPIKSDLQHCTYGPLPSEDQNCPPLHDVPLISVPQVTHVRFSTA